MCSRPGDLCENYCNRDECTTVDVILPTIVIGWSFQTLIEMEAIETLERGGWRNNRKFYYWLSKPLCVGRMNSTNAFGIFSYIINKK